MSAGMMSFLLSATVTPTFTATHRSSLHPFARLCNNSLSKQSGPFLGYGVRAPAVLQERRFLIVKASADIVGTGSSDSDPPSESDDENMAIGDLSLESKLQLKLEHKMKMKLGKNIRLRRKKTPLEQERKMASFQNEEQEHVICSSKYFAGLEPSCYYHHIHVHF